MFIYFVLFLFFWRLELTNIPHFGNPEGLKHGCFCGDPEMAGWEITQKWASMSTKGNIIELFMGGFPAEAL